MLQKYEEEGLEQLCAELRLLDPGILPDCRSEESQAGNSCVGDLLYDRTHLYFFSHPTKKQRPFRILKIGLTRDREELYDRINRRVDQMMEEGLLEEVRSVFPYRHLNSLNTVGYKELFKYLDGE